MTTPLAWVYAFLLTLALWPIPGLAKSVRVGVTLQPFQLMVEALTVPEGMQLEITQVIPDNADPHTFMLRPSDLRALDSVDVIVWGGAELEPHLERPLARLQTTHALALVEPGGPTHFWLSPDRTLRQMTRLAERLGLTVPDTIITQLQTSKASIGAALRDIRQANVEVWSFHPFMDALEADFGFHYDTLTSGDHGLSSSKLRRLEESVAMRCLIIEPEWTRLSRKSTLARHFQITTQVDPLFRKASSLPQMYHQLTEALRACIKKGG